ncbi:hypothetical protein SAMN04487761_1626 [Lachnospiraceae bacterium C7]|nr:hypothetical protein SAMN04487761_1626 [Lachnospiraceae bacterium C7]
MQYECRKKIVDYTQIMFSEITCIMTVFMIYMAYFSFGCFFYAICFLFACIPELLKMRKKIGKSVAFIKIKPDNKMIYYWPPSASEKEEHIEVDLNNAVDYCTYVKVKKNIIIADYMDEITGFKMENGEFIQINKSHFKKILGKETKNFNKQVLQIIVSNTGKNIEDLGKEEKEPIARRSARVVLLILLCIFGLIWFVGGFYMFFTDYSRF